MSHCIFSTTLSQISSYLKSMKGYDTKSMCVFVLVQSWTPKHLLLFKKNYHRNDKTNENETKVQFWSHIYFNLHKIFSSEETYGRPNQDYWGVCCFMALFGTVLSGRLNTKLYFRQLPRATFCFKTIKGKNKLPFSVWSKTQHKKVSGGP